MEDRESSFKIHLALHELEEPYREVFELRVFGELSFQDIGTIFKKTENRIKEGLFACLACRLGSPARPAVKFQLTCSPCTSQKWDPAGRGRWRSYGWESLRMRNARFQPTSHNHP